MKKVKNLIHIEVIISKIFIKIIVVKMLIKKVI